MSDKNSQTKTLKSPDQPRVCSTCGTSFEPEVQVCPKDGTPLVQDPGEYDRFIGKTVAGKYTILEMVGKGGMSVVYRAQQLPMDRVVAVKMLLGHLSHDASSVKRFFQEAKAAGNISHPNIGPIFDFGVTEDQQPYLVMEFLEGAPLSAIIKNQGRLTYQRALPLFIQLCEGLAAAHEHGVIHRDLKPGNIVIQDVPDGELARLVDFGIAKMIDTESQHLTKTGEVFGSPLYMSPEQCEGKQLDGRSDMYSLGVVFYECLSGEPPLVGGSALETMRLHLQEMPESLRKTASQAHIPVALENIIFKMMAKDREKRYASMIEVKRDLDLVYAGERGGVTGNLSYMKREISRRSKVIIASCVSIAVLSSGGIWAYPQFCTVMASQQYQQGAAAFEKEEYSAAEPRFVEAVQWSQKAKDTAGESRSLALLIKTYRMEGKTALAHEARRRRQELIKADLRRLGISEAELSMLPQVANKLSQMAEKQQQSDGSVATYDAVLATPKNELLEQKKQKTSRRDSSENFAGLGATKPMSPLPGTASGASQQVSYNTDKETANKFQSGASGASPAGLGSPMRQRRSGKSEDFGSYNTGAAGASSNSGLSFEPGTAGSTNPASSLAKQNVVACSADDEDANLVRYEAATEVSIEHGDFKKADQFASAAILVYKRLYQDQGSGLRRLYIHRAWSRLHIKQPAEAAADLRTATSLSADCPEDHAEADAMAAIAALQEGNQPEASKAFESAVNQIQRAHNKRSPHFTSAMQMLAEVARANGATQIAKGAQEFIP